MDVEAPQPHIQEYDGLPHIICRKRTNRPRQKCEARYHGELLLLTRPDIPGDVHAPEHFIQGDAVAFQLNRYFVKWLQEIIRVSVEGSMFLVQRERTILLRHDGVDNYASL
jgi:hypothetical protein